MHDFIFFLQIYLMSQVKERITKLRLLLQKVAESPCGVGEIENVLCLGSTELRRKYILDISLLIE